MGFNRWATCDAYYWYGVTHGNGQNSKEYGYLCRLLEIGYKPGLGVEYGRLDAEAAEIYIRLTRSYHGNTAVYNHCACRDCMLISTAVFCAECSESGCGLNQECKWDACDTITGEVDTGACGVCAGCQRGEQCENLCAST